MTEPIPNISIIVPVYNKAKYLAACLESILMQEFQSFEIICINDYSNDDSGYILHDFAKKDTRIKLIENDANMGAGQSRNIGLSFVKGEYIMFVDADDLLPTDSLHQLISLANTDGVDVVKGTLGFFQNNQSHDIEIRNLIEDKKKFTPLDDQDFWFPWYHTSYLFKSSFIKKHEISYPNLSHGEDPVFLARVLANCKLMSTTKETVYLYRRYPKETGSGGTSFDNLMDFIKHAKLIKDIYFKSKKQAWDNGYGPFSQSEFEKHFCKNLQLTTASQSQLNQSASQVWEELNLSSIS